MTIHLDTKIMNIKYINGCIDDSLTIDNIESVELSPDIIKEAIIRLLDNENDIGTLQSILIDLIESQGDYEDLGQCEECGDWITKYTIEV